MSTVRWDESQVEAYLRKLGSANHSAVLPTHAKQTRRDVAAPANAGKKIHPRYRICISYRSKRLADPLGRSHKAAVDGLVRSGVLRDDSQEWIESFTIAETKCERGEAEQTVIELWCVE